MLRLSLVVLLLTGSLAAQQSPPAPGLKQTGVVRALGRPIPGASITAIQGDRKVVTTTDEAGRYELDGLTPGDVIIQVDMMAFAPVSRDWLASDVAPPLDFNLDLQGLTVAAAKPTVDAPTAQTAKPQPTASAPTPDTKPAQPAKPTQ